MGIVSLLLAWVLGWPWVRASAIGEGLRPRWTRWALEALLALPCGLGATATLYFVLLWAGASPRVAAIAGDLLIGAGGLLVWRASRRATPLAVDVTEPPSFRWSWLAAVAFALGLLFFVAGFATTSGGNPQGNWDAWAIWNVRAKFLTQSETWRNAVSPDLKMTHPEYPLLWSAAIARAWSYGGDSGAPAEPIAAAGLVSMATPLLLALAVGTFEGPALGWLAGLLLLTAGPFWRQAPSQYADVPVGLLLLASLAAAALAERQKWSSRSLALSGVLAGLAAFAKNEGLFWLAVLGLTLVVVARRAAVAWIAGAVLAASVTAGFKLLLAPPTHVFAPALLADAGRLGLVLAGFGVALWRLGDLPAQPILLLALLAFGLKLLRPPMRWWPLVPVVLLLAGDVTVLWGTPNDISWMIETAVDRLLVQILPCALFACFLLLRVPAAETVPAAPRDRSEARPHRRRQR